MRKKILLGITEENEIVFADVEITTRNGYKEFTASFDTVAPFENEEADGVEYYEELLDTCYTDADKYKLCERYDCSPSELASEMAEDMGVETLADEKDCSLYNNRIYVDGVEYAFESMCFGQHDIVEDETMKEFVNKALAMRLYDLWEKYHLKAIDEATENEIAETVNALEIEAQEEEAIIASYIRKYLI